MCTGLCFLEFWDVGVVQEALNGNPETLECEFPRHRTGCLLLRFSIRFVSLWVAVAPTVAQNALHIFLGRSIAKCAPLIPHSLPQWWYQLPGVHPSPPEDAGDGAQDSHRPHFTS